MTGGNTIGVDYLLMNTLKSDSDFTQRTVLYLPSTKSDNGRHITRYILERQVAVPRKALDKLLWAYLSWSTHRRLCGICMAFFKEQMHYPPPYLADSLSRSGIKASRSVIETKFSGYIELNGRNRC